MIEAPETLPSSEGLPRLFSSRIAEDHLRLHAVLCVRQSTTAQLREHQESTARQYAMKDRLIALGWPYESIRTEWREHTYGKDGKVLLPVRMHGVTHSARRENDFFFNLDWAIEHRVDEDSLNQATLSTLPVTKEE